MGRGRAEHPGDTSLPRVVVTMGSGLVFILVHLKIKNELSVLSYEDTRHKTRHTFNNIPGKCGRAEYSRTTYLRCKNCFHDTRGAVVTVVDAVDCWCQPRGCVSTDAVCRDSAGDSNWSQGQGCDNLGRPMTMVCSDSMSSKVSRQQKTCQSWSRPRRGLRARS